MPFGGDRRSLAAVAMLGAAAAAVAIVVVTTGLGGGSPSTPPQPARTGPPLVVPSPVPRQPVTGFGFSAVDDQSTHQLVLFGGVDSYSTTWLWNGRRWTLAHPSASPLGRFGAAAAYDPRTGMVMLYGGRLGPGQVVDDTWEWDGTTWRELDTGTGSPPVGEGSSMAWDSAGNRMVLLAGDETWVWSEVRSLWVRQPNGDLPPGTAIAGVAFDPVTHALVAISCCAPQVTTFRWDGARWGQVNSGANSPAIVSLALDPLSNRLLLCSDPSLSVAGQQMWSWNGTDWIAIAGSRLPALPEAEVTDVDDGHVLILDFVVEASRSAPQPIHVWSWTGSSWQQRG